MIATVVFFVLLLGVLILAHEWGHFFVARKFGVRVEEFAFGFPPRVASFVGKGTRYAFNLLPLGGYVKIYGESGEAKRDPESFSSRPVWQRLAIIAAGVFMNIVLAWILFSLGHGLGLPTVVGENDGVPGARVAVVGIQPDSPAARAGLKFGDAIRELKTGDFKTEIASADEVQKFVGDNKGREVLMVVERGKERIEFKITPRSDPPAGEGPLGIAMAKIGVVRSPAWRAPVDGAKTTASAVLAIIQALGGAVRDLFTEGRVSADVAGPVGIFFFADDTRRLGLIYLIELAGVLSVNLALLNILPVPALDGGRILFLLIERLRGVKVNQRLEQLIHTIGFVILIMLMAAVTYRDIVRVF